MLNIYAREKLAKTVGSSSFIGIFLLLQFYKLIKMKKAHQVASFDSNNASNTAGKVASTDSSALLTSLQDYVSNNPFQIKLIDSLLLYTLFIAFAQLLHLLIAGNFPLNSFLSGIVSSIGTFALTVALRIQIVQPKEFNLPMERAFADYLVSIGVLYLAVFTFMG